jgi:hypothetical protein
MNLLLVVTSQVAASVPPRDFNLAVHVYNEAAR